MSGVTVGIGEREITPIHPVPLAGFAVRMNKPFMRTDRKLWVRSWWIGDDSSQFLLVIADVLWWAPERERAIRQNIASQWNIPVDHILLHATHTHSAPQTSYVFVESLGAPDDRWVSYFESQVLASVEEAFKDRTPARIERHVGTSDIGYNRRVLIDVPYAPEGSDGLVDRTVTVIKVSSMDGRPRGMMVHHACHPTTTSRPHVSSEWPGIACELLRSRFGNVSMLQGACGDINPRITRGLAERHFTDRDVEAVASEIVDDIMRALDEPGEPIIMGNLSAHNVTAECRTTSIPNDVQLTEAELTEGLDREWATALRRFPDRCVTNQPLHITHLSLGESLGFVALSAEVTTQYGLAIKEIGGRHLLPLGYTNGMTGYIVTDTQLENGGYEPDGSTKYFALPSAFAPGLEAVVMDGIRAVLQPEVTQ